MAAREVVDYLADKVVELRNTHSKRYTHQMTLYSREQRGPVPTQAIVGGFVRSYNFDYTRGQRIAQGIMTVQFESGHRDYAATMVILGGQPVDGITAERIVESTQKISDCSDAVVEAYFSAYCKAINRWIVVYEPFEQNLNPPSFLRPDDPSNLTDFWRRQVRSFINALSLAEERQVVHGSLSEASSYVMSGGRVKVINVARRQNVSNEPISDLYDLRRFIWGSPILHASNSENWKSLNYLLGCKRMKM